MEYGLDCCNTVQKVQYNCLIYKLVFINWGGRDAEPSWSPEPGACSQASHFVTKLELTFHPDIGGQLMWFLNINV